MRNHSLAGCHLILGAIEVKEFGESDAIDIQPNSDMVTMSVSADGVPTFDSSNDDNFIAEIVIKQNSFAYSIIAKYITAQKLALKTVGRVPPLVFSYTNLATGDLCYCVAGVFLTDLPMMAKKTSGEITVRIGLPSPTFDRGTAIVPVGVV